MSEIRPRDLIEIYKKDKTKEIKKSYDRDLETLTNNFNKLLNWNRYYEK